MSPRVIWEQYLECLSQKIIVEVHGGRIWAGNNTDGKGATSVLVYLH